MKFWYRRGAIAWLRQNFPSSEIVGIAHSIASLIVGGARNSADQRRLVLVGAHTGYYGDYHQRYRNLPFIGVLKPEILERRSPP